MMSIGYSSLAGTFYALKYMQIKFCCRSGKVHFTEFLSAFSVALVIITSFESLIIYRKLPLLNTYLLFSGPLNAGHNIFLGYALDHGEASLACAISTSVTVWYAIIDYFVKGTVLTGIDCLAIAFLTSGSLTITLSES